ncbi:MAG: hypothetical protein KDC44_03370, partial [Phaeodactylibacter sp.]|nr:hypothetical protein [Phaeodactylibacter sp.]
LLSEKAQGRRRLIKESDALFRLVAANIYPWPDNFAIQTIDAFKDYLYDVDIVDWNVWHYRTILEKASLCIAPSLFEYVKKDWPSERSIWGLWEQEVLRLLRRLQFRVQMHRYIKS